MSYTNEQFSDLYGTSILPYVSLPPDATFNQIIEVANSNKLIGYKHQIKCGDRNIIAMRKYTWNGNVAKTSYLHIWHVKDFESEQVIAHWREQKNGVFKIV